MVQQPSYWKVLTRRKVLSTEGGETETKLNRVLGLYDLTALGVGSTLGAGVYVLAGQIAKEQAGPSVMLSFAIAALASLLAGVCYAEFGARVPKAGSAYVYSYVCIGEFAAFVIGWNLILEYVIGTAAVCRGISLYLDTLINDTLKTTFAEIAPMNVSFFGSYFDLFAFGLVVVFGVALAFGVETSALANNFCTCLNISILLFVIIAGSIKANFANWSIDVNELNSTVGINDTTSDLGAGGYFPFGFTGTLRGAATCFFGFVGFDCIATTGEEVRNPRRNIPRSLMLSLFIIFVCYFGVSTVLTLMVPYYNQDPNAPLPYAFKEVGWNFAMWIVSIGGLVGLLASLFGALFPLPRIMYSMAEDGLLFHFLGKVSPRFRVPVNGSIFAAIMTALIAGLFDLAQLVNLLSIGTLLAYSVVAISITILRYMDNTIENEQINGQQTISETTMLTKSGTRISATSVLVQLFNLKRVQTPNTISTRIVGILITTFCLLSLFIGLILMEAYDDLINNQVWVQTALGILVGLTILVLIAICLQPREIFLPRISVFRVPFVPIVPAVSIFINIYLMLQLDPMTWIRFGIWMVIGIPMFIACYCMYDLKNPQNRNPNRIAFEKALKSSGTDNNGNSSNKSNGNHLNGFLPNSLEATENGKSNGKTPMGITQNQLSLKSLDEIVNMSDIGEELIEMRHPNGKVFYIEDTRSNTSAGSVEREENDGLRTIKTEASEEEKSVIAMLDDVLQGEDDGGALLTPVGIHDYSRKFSVDSEMLPSVIETTIVATVHSSSDSSEHDLDEVPEVNEDNVASENENSPVENLEHHEICTEMAQKLVNDILESEEVQQVLQSHNIKEEENEIKDKEEETKEIEEVKEKEKEIFVPIIPMVASQNEQKLLRKISEASMASSVEDPLHSENFKNKLSKIILQQPYNTIQRGPKDENNEITEEKRPTLKHSKSEADVRALVLKAIQDIGKEKNNDNIEDQNSIENIQNGIPKAPKFDPILYQTVNSLSNQKSRPSINKFINEQDDTNVIPNEKASQPEMETIENSNPTLFKTKLEAILKRGPSHRSQKRPDIEIRTQRPKTMHELRSPIYEATNSSIPTKYENHTKIQTINNNNNNNTSNNNNINNNNNNNINTISPNDSSEELILNARKALRHVQNGPIVS